MCICAYADDDGNTIFCERCTTWQHIDCYYPHRAKDASREDFEHVCAECRPRPMELDRITATARQQRWRMENVNVGKARRIYGLESMRGRFHG